MSQRAQLVLLAVLVFVLAVVSYGYFGPGTGISFPIFANEKFEPMNLPDPKLRLDLLANLQKLEYEYHRSIFEMRRPKPPDPTPPVNPNPQPTPPDNPQIVESPAVPYRFYGYATDPGTGKKRAFFTDGDDVFILYEGDTLKARYKLNRIGAQSAEVEEIATGRRSTLQLEQPPA